MAFRIETITAFVATTNADEGIIGFFNAKDKEWVPLVCADEKRVESVIKLAEVAKQETGHDYRILQFSVRRDVTDEIKEKYSHLLFT